MTKPTDRQTIFQEPSILEEDIANVKIIIKKIFYNLKEKINDPIIFENLLKGEKISSKEIVDNQKPEEFTKQNIILPFFSLLKYDWTSETRLAVPGGKKDPDYIIHPHKQETDFLIYVEAEPINTKLLKNKGHGADQINDWLISRASKSSYGIATDGFKWILIRFNQSSNLSEPILQIDLLPFFQQLLFKNIQVEEEILQKFISLRSDNFLYFTGQIIAFEEINKNNISKKFYLDYVRYVFGIDEHGKITPGICLIEKIIAPRGSKSEDRNLFAVLLINRLLFIKFLEEKALVQRNLMTKMLEEYQNHPPLATFYKSYLSELFFNIFNKHPEKRNELLKKKSIFYDIPYLNGGLFRERIVNEYQYDVDNEGLKIILEKLIEGYNFSGKESLNPDILGYVFEKTINYISGTGNNEQRIKGAYYTPDYIVQFINEKTLIPIIFLKIINGLTKVGWTDIDLRHYKSIDDFFSNPPKNPIDIESIIDEIESIRILDPGCGSGHFLTSILSEFVRIKVTLYNLINKPYDRYELKSEIISNNIFGVDIDENAVEIAKLRLWLSLIEEVNTNEHIKTLPNIDFNIITGNTLLGWTHEKFESPIISQFQDDYIDASLDNLAIRYPDVIDEIRIKISTCKVNDTVYAYNKLIEVYNRESGVCAADIQKILEKIKIKLYIILNDFFIRFIQEKSSFTKNEILIFKNISERKPLHWNVDFGEIIMDEGFDVITGNPPYISDTYYDKIDLKIIKSSKSSLKKSDIKQFPLLFESRDCENTFAYFIERSLSLLKKGGKLGFIVSNSWLGGPNYLSIRNVILKYDIEIIIQLPYDVFQDAYVDTCLLILTNKKSETPLTKTYTYPSREKLININLSNSDYSLINQERWKSIRDQKIILDSKSLDIFEHISTNLHCSFKEIVEIKRGVRAKKSTLKNSKINDQCLPFFEGSVYRYTLLNKIEHWVIYNELIEKPAELKWFEGERILLRRLISRRNRMMATITHDSYITKKDIYSIIKLINDVELKVILALINSKIFSFLYLCQISQATKDDFPQLTITDIKEIPIPDKNLLIQSNNIVALVDQIISINDELSDFIKINGEEISLMDPRIQKYEDEIDNFFYDLYQLNDDMRNTVEKFFP